MAEIQEPLHAVTSNLVDFSTDFYKELSKDVSSNIICSPFSIATVLAMVSMGAGGNTRKQLHDVLHLSDDETTVKRGFQSLIDTLKDIKGVELSVANKIFAASGFNIKPEFKSATENWFRSTLTNLDFTRRNEASTEINSWCSTTTRNRIKTIVEADDLKDARLVLVNAVYFKGNWAEKFDPKMTRNQDFYIDENTRKKVPMMYRNGKYNSGPLPQLNAEYIEVPYASEDPKNSISMFIILPSPNESLRNVEAKLEDVDFSQLRQFTSSMDLMLPKFKIESKFDLKKFLQKMNVRDMFEDNANFTGITETSSLKVSKIIQKAFIEVNEEGSEAAAITGLQVMPMSLPPRFRADRPFFCVIVAQGVHLFHARVTDPTL